MVAKTFDEWFNSGRQIQGYDAFKQCWDAATEAMEEKFTSTNTGSPKLPSVKDMVHRFVDDKSTCADGRDMRVLSQFCEFVYRQHRAGA